MKTQLLVLSALCFQLNSAYEINEWALMKDKQKMTKEIIDTFFSTYKVNVVGPVYDNLGRAFENKSWSKEKFGFDLDDQFYQGSGLKAI